VSTECAVGEVREEEKEETDEIFLGKTLFLNVN
jgi:hypothetical protein